MKSFNQKAIDSGFKKYEYKTYERLVSQYMLKEYNHVCKTAVAVFDTYEEAIAYVRKEIRELMEPLRQLPTNFQYYEYLENHEKIEVLRAEFIEIGPKEFCSKYNRHGNVLPSRFIVWCYEVFCLTPEEKKNILSNRAKQANEIRWANRA